MMVAVIWLDGGSGGHSRIMEVVAVVLCRVVVACMVWWLQLHGLMVAMAGGGCSSCSHITEAAVVMPHYVGVAAWHGSCGYGHMA
jgi:hypothetical protein